MVQLNELKKLNKIKKGSFTIEAAGLMGAVLLVIFAVLYGNFYVHNRAWLTAAAYEAAITGSLEGSLDRDAYASADNRGRMLGNTGFYGLGDFYMRTAVGDQVQVDYEGHMASAFGGLTSKLHVQGSSKIFRPVSFIRNVRMAKELGEVLKGE